MWVGASDSYEKKMINIAFLGIRIENIIRCFEKDEVSEIWITFPDPQIQRRRSNKRLTHPNFLEKYKSFLHKNGVINLKTDSSFLYGYTLGIIEGKNYQLLDCTNDLYGVHQIRKDMDIITHYEKIYLKKNIPITYIKFQIKNLASI